MIGVTATFPSARPTSTNNVPYFDDWIVTVKGTGERKRRERRKKRGERVSGSSNFRVRLPPV